MHFLAILIVASTLYYTSAHSDEEFLHLHYLPEECSANDFFTLLYNDNEGGCEPCRCLDDEWERLQRIYDPDMCCKKFGLKCQSTQCKFGDSSIVVDDGFCVTCDCSDESYWTCNKWYNKEECCNRYSKLCECYTGDVKSVSIDQGCYRCSCQNGFWDCKTNITYTQEECCDKWNVECPHCCADGKLHIDLRNKPFVANSIDGIELIIGNERKTGCQCDGDMCRCSGSALLKIEFDKLEPHCGCAKEPMCGRRQLQIDLKLGGRRKGIFLNIGDSQFNSGVGGDQTTATKYDAEIVAKDNNIYVYQNEYCNHAELPYLDALPHGSEHVRFNIGNEFVRIQSHGELVVSRCDRCLFGLDRKAGNNAIYVGLNTAVDGSSNGAGIHYARFHWVCPSINNDWVNYMKKERPDEF